MNAATQSANVTQSELAEVRALIGAGMDEPQISEELGWALERVEEAKARIFADEERRLIGRRTEVVYVDYVMRTRAHMRELDEAIAKFKKSKQGSALVGAIKAKQDLLDKIVNRGQEFGFIEKKPTRSEHMVVLANLDDPALRELLHREVLALDAMMTANGGRHLLEVEEAPKPVSAFEHDPDPQFRPPKQESEFQPKGFAPSPGGEEKPSVIRRKARRLKQPSTGE